MQAQCEGEREERETDSRSRMQTSSSTTCNLLKGHRDHFRMITNAIRCLRHAEALESPRVSQSHSRSQAEAVAVTAKDSESEPTSFASSCLKSFVAAEACAFVS